MTRLSERIRAIAEGHEPVRKAAFDEFCPVERSIDELLQGIADRIEEEAAANGTGTDAAEAATALASQLVEEQEKARQLSEALAKAKQDRADAAAGIVAMADRLHAMEDDWQAVGNALGVMPSAYPTEGGWHVACLDALWRTVEGLAPVGEPLQPAAPAWWPCWSDGEPIGPGDDVTGGRVERVTVTEDGWHLYHRSRKVLASGAPGETLERPDSWDAIVGELHARHLPEADTAALLDLLDRVRRLG